MMVIAVDGFPDTDPFFKMTQFSQQSNVVRTIITFPISLRLWEIEI